MSDNDKLSEEFKAIGERIEKLEKWKRNQENIDKAMRIEINKNIPKLKEAILKDLGIESIKKELSELKKKYSYLNTNRHLNKRMDGWISQIIIYKKDIDDKIYDINTQISELKEQIGGNDIQFDDTIKGMVLTNLARINDLKEMKEQVKSKGL